MDKVMLLEVPGASNGGHNYSIRFWAGEVAEVFLIDYPANAINTLAKTTRGYAGTYSDRDLTDEERSRFLTDISKTLLGSPLEMLNFVFLIRDVPRSFTHQIVRTRVGASYVQESTRFIGAMDTYSILVPKTAHGGNSIDPYYVAGNVAAIRAYEDMLEQKGVANQDARQLFPHGLLTHIFASLTFKTLQTIYNQRFCCQAESSTWLPVVKQMKSLIQKQCGNALASLLTAPVDRGQPCGYNASFDRVCVWKNGEKK